MVGLNETLYIEVFIILAICDKQLSRNQRLFLDNQDKTVSYIYGLSRNQESSPFPPPFWRESGIARVRCLPREIYFETLSE